MPLIHVLDEPTINQIAAGEVVERPCAVVKELIENAMDAGATAITAEIKEGGLSFIRITDNGSGIAREDIPLAFLRHATSKIRTAEDLLSVTSLGFRGEALSSIAAVAQLELITKTPSSLNGYRYMIEGGEEKSMEEIGCPGGTTIIVRNIFYNTPARRKFLKSAMTEAGYISDLMERLMVSHPGVSFKFIINNQVKLQSSGNNSSKDILYHVYGRDITRELLPVKFSSENLKITGFIGKPAITRGNRNYENYFINGRYIRSNIITKAIEEAYKPFMMQHKYPFTSLYFEINPALIDVNVHPQKMEIRLKNGEESYQYTYQTIRDILSGKELIPRVILSPREEAKKEAVSIPEPFEENRRKQFVSASDEKNNSIGSIPSTQVKSENIEKLQERKAASFTINYKNGSNTDINVAENSKEYHTGQNDTNRIIISKEASAADESKHFVIPIQKPVETDNVTKIVNIPETDNVPEIVNVTEIDKIPESDDALHKDKKNAAAGLSDFDRENTDKSAINESLTDITGALNKQPQIMTGSQLELFSEDITQDEAPFISKAAFDEHRIIGQLFSTYWLVEYKEELYIIDQHAAHEKVLYEKIMKAAKNKTYESQQLMPPIVLSLTLREQEAIKKQEEILNSLGYEFEYFGGNEFSVRAVPADLYGISEKDLLLEFIDSMADDIAGNTTNSESILERIASMSCKAAVKANHTLSNEEAQALIGELLTLDNPYNCPHGRPVIIKMSKYELERRFKRIL